MTSPHVRAASEVAGIGEATGYRYAALPAVRAALAARQDAAMAQAAAKLGAALGEALDVLVGIMRAADAPLPVRVSAARGVLAHGARLVELLALAERVRVLEEHFAEEDGR